MPNTQKEKKLVGVTFSYDDGTTKALDEENATLFQENLNATSLMSLRGHKFHELEWTDATKSREVIDKLFKKLKKDIKQLGSELNTEEIIELIEKTRSQIL